MSRPVLDESRIHPAIRERIATHHADVVREVQQAVESNDVVVVGMAVNPFPKRARRALRESTHDTTKVASLDHEVGS